MFETFGIRNHIIISKLLSQAYKLHWARHAL